MTSPLPSEIDDYLNNGYALFPVTIKTVHGKSHKVPRVKEWQSLTPDPDLDKTTLGSQYGVPLQKTDLVIDIDPRRFKHGINSIEMMWYDLQLASPNTFMVATLNAGNHIYYKKPADMEVVRNLERVYPGIEIKSSGQYVVGAGSQFGDKSYTCIRGSLDAVQDAPQALLDFLKTYDASRKMDEAIQDDSQINQDRYIRFLLYNAHTAVEGQGGDNTTYTVACYGKDLGLTPETTYELMRDYYNDRCAPPWSEEKLHEKVEHAYQYSKSTQGVLSTAVKDVEDVAHLYNTDEPDDLPVTKFDFYANSRRLRPTFANACYMFWERPLETNPLYNLVRYNELSNRVEFMRKAPWHKHEKTLWDDQDDIELKFYLSHVKHFEVGTKVCTEAAEKVALHMSYHPVQQWLEGLQWDGVDRIDSMFSTYCGSPDSIYTRAVAKTLMLGLVARTYKPSCKFDYMVILEGRQGIGKSTFISILGGQWAGEFGIDVSTSQREADTVAKMQPCMLVETPEMAFLKRNEMEAIKNFLSRSTDYVRLAYARSAKNYPRHTIFMGSINPQADKGYLKDPTGARRFLPIVTTEFTLDAVRDDREQLFAEALTRFNLGEEHYISDEVILKMAERIQSSRSEQESWAEIIDHEIEKRKEFDATFDDMYDLTYPFIANTLLGLPTSACNAVTARRIAEAMKTLDYEKIKTTDPESRKTVRAYRKIGAKDYGQYIV